MSLIHLSTQNNPMLCFVWNTPERPKYPAAYYIYYDPDNTYNERYFVAAENRTRRFLFAEKVTRKHLTVMSK